jgi:hypothetical protein
MRGFIAAAKRRSQRVAEKGMIRDCAEIYTWLRHTYPCRAERRLG